MTLSLYSNQPMPQSCISLPFTLFYGSSHLSAKTFSSSDKSFHQIFYLMFVFLRSQRYLLQQLLALYFTIHTQDFNPSEVYYFIQCKGRLPVLIYSGLIFPILLLNTLFFVHCFASFVTHIFGRSVCELSVLFLCSIFSNDCCICKYLDFGD